MRGTVYIYQGDEIGMTNVAYPSIEHYNDVETLNAYKEARSNGQDMDEFLSIVHSQSRDNARTPMQWDSGKNAGFSDARPWLGINPNHAIINVSDQQENPNSILNYYRKMIGLRKENPTLVYGDYEDLHPEHPSIFAYKRWDENATFLILHNMSDSPESVVMDFNESALELCITNIPEDSKPKFYLGAWQTKVFSVIK